MFDIGGLSNYKMIGADTIRGDSLKKFPVAGGKKPQATTTVITKPSNAFQILWLDTKGKRRVGVIRVKKKKDRNMSQENGEVPKNGSSSSLFPEIA